MSDSKGMCASVIIGKRKAITSGNWSFNSHHNELMRTLKGLKRWKMNLTKFWTQITERMWCEFVSCSFFLNKTNQNGTDRVREYNQSAWNPGLTSFHFKENISRCEMKAFNHVHAPLVSSACIFLLSEANLHPPCEASIDCKLYFFYYCYKSTRFLNNSKMLQHFL